MAPVEPFLRDALTEVGFTGWVPWRACPEALKSIPSDAGGVYVVYRESFAPPVFLAASPAGTWRGDPTVPATALDANWVDGAHVLNIGKANHGRLRTRLREYIGFGRGGRSRHAGGRLVWQLADSEQHLVAWRVLPQDETPQDVETDLIAAFRASYGMPPFANNPDRLGR